MNEADEHKVYMFMNRLESFGHITKERGHHYHSTLYVWGQPKCRNTYRTHQLALNVSLLLGNAQGKTLHRFQLFYRAGSIQSSYHVDTAAFPTVPSYLVRANLDVIGAASSNTTICITIRSISSCLYHIVTLIQRYTSATTQIILE